MVFPYKEELSYFVSVDVNNLLQSGKYEKVILEVLNKSTIVFPETYTHLDNQSNGESDYLSISGKKYDIKLLMTKQQGQDLLSNSKNIERYYEEVVDLTNQITNHLMTDNIFNDTELVKQIVRLVKKIEIDENLIVLFAYPFMGLRSDSFIDVMFADYLDVIFPTIEDLFIDRNLYAIIPTLDNKLYLKNVSKEKTEIIESSEFFKYVRTIEKR